ncbi:MAG: alpha/beta fold hydrolase [Clostridia bacterium]|jgi:hypothetical protein|nr:alpha/beta hydrolase [Clostridium sp.]MEE0126914.1 alpha/beta hydrolase [Clostridia bacterium]HJJ13136.1 alpha/beta hydrolase [Clostridiaceae bacterium]
MQIENIISEKDCLQLEVAILEPKEKPKGIVQISHGMSEHKERYYEFMKYLSENGYICVIHDHRGHGASVKNKRDLGYFYTEDINYIIDDLYQITKYIKNKYPDLKINLFAHSMGTLVARGYLKKYDDKINKMILSGPPTENSMALLGLMIAKFLNIFYKKNVPNKLLNNLTFGNYSKDVNKKNEWICLNEDIVEAYNKDELCGYIFTTNGFINLYKLMINAFKKNNWNMKNKNLPIYIIAGRNDKVIQNEEKFTKLSKFITERGYKNVQSKLYNDMKHEILNEKNNKIVYKDILDFIENEQ